MCLPITFCYFKNLGVTPKKVSPFVESGSYMNQTDLSEREASPRNSVSVPSMGGHM